MYSPIVSMFLCCVLLLAGGGGGCVGEDLGAGAEGVVLISWRVLFGEASVNSRLPVPLDDVERGI